MISVLKVILRFSAAGLAGLLAAQIMPPRYGMWLLLPVGVGTLYFLARDQKAKVSGLVGLCGGVGYFLPLLRWMDVVGTDAWVLLTLLCASWWWLAFSLLPRLSNGTNIPLTFATVWSGIEVLRDTLPWGGFGWAQFGVAVPLTPLAGLAPNVGQLGSTWLITAVSCLCAELVYQRSFPRITLRGLAAGTAVIAVSFVPFNFGLVHQNQSARVSVVQGGVDHYGLGTFGDIRAVLKHHVDTTLMNRAVVDTTDLVVWPENAADINPQTDVVAASMVNDVVRAIHPPILMGAVQSQADNTLHNISLLWSRTGNREVYIKRKVVPFGEYMPMRELVTSLTDRAALMPRDFSPGTTHGSIDVANVHFGILICFEVADAGLALTDDDNASAWIVHTNNATYQFTGQSEQQLLAGQMRAAETRRPFIISSTSGISAIIDSNGRVIHRIDQTDTGVIVGTFSSTKGKTGAMLLYPVLRPALPLLAIGLVGLSFRRRKVGT